MANQSLSESAASRSWVSILLSAVVGVTLVWAVLSRSLAEYLAEAAPEWAVVLAPTNSTALLNLADAKLGIKADARNAASNDGRPRTAAGLAAFNSIKSRGIPVPMTDPEVTPGVRMEVRRLAEAALASDPLSARAFRILGQVADTPAQQRAYMEKAALRSKHEVHAVYWLMQTAFLDDDLSKTTQYIDILLRSQPQLMPAIVPILARLAESERGLEPAKALLRSDPPWRNSFFSSLMHTVTDARTPLVLMLDLQTHGRDPSHDELKYYLAFLMEQKYYELAYYTWTQFLPPESLQEVGLLFNSSFALRLSGLPFDWTLMRDQGARVDIVDRADKPEVRALAIEYLGVSAGEAGARQIVTLAPGKYRLSGAAQGDVRARRGVRWRVACLGAVTTYLGESEAFTGSAPNWKTFQFDFVVPPQNCPAQQVWVALDARTDSERLASGNILFSELKLATAGK